MELVIFALAFGFFMFAYCVLGLVVELIERKTLRLR